MSVLNLTNAEFLALIFSEKIAKIHTHGQSISVHFRSISEAGKTFALSHLKTINCGDLYIFQRSNLSWTKVAFYFFHLRERKDIKRKITKASRKHGSNKRIKLEQSLIRQSRRLWETCLLLLFLLLSARLHFPCVCSVLYNVTNITRALWLVVAHGLLEYMQTHGWDKKETCFLYFTMLWRHLWSVTEQKHGKMEPFCYVGHRKRSNILHLPVLDMNKEQWSLRDVPRPLGRRISQL